ncbi:hypothetical protein F0U59_17670 [Archangium gephyra]|nr:hypothetical protein F0U59_17670 [Archangium gephyra]
MIALICALLSCTGEAPVHRSNGPTEKGRTEASLSRELPLAHFRGHVDVERGTLTFESAAPPKGLARWGSNTRQPLAEVLVVQDGKEGSGPVNTVELVPTRLSTDSAECGAAQRFCGEVTVRSFYAVPLRDVWIELDAMAPETGFESYNSSTSVPPGLSNHYGLWSYGDLELRGASHTARWGFNLARSQKRFTFTGRVMAGLTASDAPVANAGPDQNVFNGDTVQLDGTDSADPQERPLQYQWTLVSKPAGSTAALANATTATPTFETDLTGDYTLELVVNNGTEDSAPDTVTISSVFRNTLAVTSTTLLTSATATMTVTLGSPAGPGGQTVNLASNDSTIASVPTSVHIPDFPTGNRSATFTVTSGTRSGSATITAFATNFFDGTGTVTVNKRGMTLALTSSLVGVSRTLEDCTLTLAQPAPASGVTVNLSTNANNVATLSPLGITFAPGQSTATFDVTGVSEGQAEFTAQAQGYSDATAKVTVTSASTLNIPGGVVVAPDQTLSFPISLSTPAPAGGLTAQLTSSAPGVVLVTPSVFVPEGATAPSVQPTVTGVTLGSASITATGDGYAPDTRTVDVRLTMNFSPTSIAMPVDNMATLVLSLSAPAPAGGVTVDLRTDNPARATVPATVTFAAGQSQADVTVTGVAAGNTTLRASGVGLNEATAAVTVNPAPALSINSATVGKDLRTSSNGSLAAPAPAGNLQITFTSADASKVLLATTAGGPGSGSITLQVGAGDSSIPTFYIYGLEGSGTVQLTATAPGYARGTATVTLRPSGFYFSTTSITATSFDTNKSVSIALGMLNPVTLAADLGSQPLRPGVSTSVAVTSSNEAVGVITTSPVTFSAGESSNTTSFDPLGGGSTTLTLIHPAGFTVPSTKTQITATVTAPNLSLSNYTLGKDLQFQTYASLGDAMPTGGGTLTVSVADPTKALLSTSPTAVGTGSLTFTLAAGATRTPDFYVQALAGSGTVQYTATASGYNSKTATLTFVPSGVVLRTCANCSDSSFSTTTFATNTSLSAVLAKLNPTTLNYDGYQELRPGAAPVVVEVTSSNPDVGTVTVSPLTIGTNQATASTAFDPANAGSTTLTISTPAGFSTPNNYRQMPVTVTAPNLNLSNQTLGKDLQLKASASLAVAAPAGNTQVTITVADPTKALLSTSPTAVGTGSLTFTVFAGSTNIPDFYVQALAGSGTVQYTATAPGYNSKTATLTFVPSGVVLRMCANCSDSSFSTTTFTTNTSLSAVLAKLNPTTLSYDGYQELRPGAAPVVVDVTSSSTHVGTITASPLTIGTNQFTASTAFDPLNAGSTTLTISTPTGFSTPSNYRQMPVTVTAPNLSLSNQTLGKDLQLKTSASLGDAVPTGGVTLTVSVADPTKALLSTSATVVGTGSLTFTLAAGATKTPDFYVQALAGSGTVQYTATAPGYNSKTATLTFVPSGVVLRTCANCSDSSFSTTTFATNTTLWVVLAKLNPTTLNYDGYQELRPEVDPVVVEVTSSNPDVGTVTVSPLTIGTNQFMLSTAFDPLNAGSTTLTISTPTGFSTPSNYRQMPVTVTAPNLNLSNQTLGKDLQLKTSASLGNAVPAGGVTLTVSVADPTKALLSTSATAIGTGSLTFTLAAGATRTPDFYVQALAGSGTVQYTATAPGYNSKTATLTFVPSGVVLRMCANCSDTSFSTTVSASNTSLWVVLAKLTPTTLNYDGYQELRPGVDPVVVEVTSSNPDVGTVTVSPLTIGTNQFMLSTAFDPLNAGSTTLTISTPTGFSTPSNYRQMPVTVTAPVPDISLSNKNIGKDLQVSAQASLTTAAPAGGVTLTISADPTKIRLSTSPDVLGTSGTLTFTIAAGSRNTPEFYVQALVGSGSVPYTATASGYTSKTATLTLYPSGFVITGFSDGSFTTTTASSDTTLKVHPAALEPFTLNLKETQQLRPGLSNVLVSVTSSNESVGTITLAPVVFNGADVPNYRTTSFHPVSAGTTTLVVSGPSPDFSQSSNNNHITATVTP